MQKKGTKRTLHIDMVAMGSLTALHRQLLQIMSNLCCLQDRVAAKQSLSNLAV